MVVLHSSFRIGKYNPSNFWSDVVTMAKHTTIVTHKNKPGFNFVRRQTATLLDSKEQCHRPDIEWASQQLPHVISNSHEASDHRRLLQLLANGWINQDDNNCAIPPSSWNESSLSAAIMGRPVVSKAHLLGG
jgi:hypothetical protein